MSLSQALSKANNTNNIVNLMGVEGGTYLTTTVPNCVQNIAKESNGKINIQAEKENIDKMLKKFL